MLRLHDHRTGRAEALPGGRGLRVQVLTGATGYRRAIVADLLRRVAERGGRRVRVCCAPATADDLADYNVQPFEDASLPDPDVYVSGAADTDALCLVVPNETGDWAAPDALAVRLAMLETPYREPLDLSPARVSSARERLDGWRRGVAGWATSRGVP